MRQGRTAIDAATRARIKEQLEAFVERAVEQYKGYALPDARSACAYLDETSADGNLKPFHAAIIPDAFLRISAFERSFSTSLGSTFEECARLLAEQRHGYARRQHKIQADVSKAAVAEIERQVQQFEHAAEAGRARPSLAEMAKAVLEARREHDLQPLGVTADLFVRTRDNRELYFELKSPKPNKGQCLEITQRLLRFHLARGVGPPRVCAYFAMAYNPFGLTRENYAWRYPRDHMPFGDAVLIAEEFWETVGARGAYQELLAIYQQVGREKAGYITGALTPST